MWQLNKKHWRWVVNILLFHLLAAIATSNLRRVMRPILMFFGIPGGKLGFRNFEIPAGLLLNLCSGERLFYDVALFCTKLSHMVLSSLTQFLGRWMHIKEVVVHWCRYKGGKFYETSHNYSERQYLKKRSACQSKKFKYKNSGKMQSLQKVASYESVWPITFPECWLKPQVSVSRNVFKVKTHGGATGAVEEKTNAKQRDYSDLKCFPCAD